MSSPRKAALPAVVALGAVLRFSTLDVQSFWFDEAVTVGLLDRSFGSMVAGIPGSESTPPLYYLIAYGWSKLFGTGEVGLRSLSALFGTATVPAAYAAGRTLVSERAGLFAAGLVAVNPLLVWYSQEVRAYALLVLLASLSFVFFARALRRPGRRDLALWALFSGLALAAHYFAAFPVALEGAWLLLAGGRGRRERALAVAAVAVVAAALVPLAVAQRGHRGAEFIEDAPLLERAVQVPKQLLIGFDAPLELLVTLAAAGLAVVAAVLLRSDADPAARRGAYVAALVGAAPIAAVLVLALAGIDYLLGRNLIASVVPLAVALGAGFAAVRRTASGLALTCALCVLSLAAVVSVAAEPRFRRDDWRGAAESLGPARVARTVTITPNAGVVPLRLYLRGARGMPTRRAVVQEVAMVGLARRSSDGTEPPPREVTTAPQGFEQVRRREAETFTSAVFHAPGPRTVHVRGLQATRIGPPAGRVLLQPPER